MTTFHPPPFHTRSPLGRGFPSNNNNNLNIQNMQSMPIGHQNNNSDRFLQNQMNSRDQSSNGIGGGGGGIRQQQRQPTSMSKSRHSGKEKNLGNLGIGKVEDDYVRNLQQQIYLLELETRYLRTPQTQGEDHDPQNGLPINDKIKGLKNKYLELQENNSKEIKRRDDQVEMLRSQNDALNVTLDMVEKDREQLKEELQMIKDNQIGEKDKIYGELITLKKKLEITQADHARMDITYKRIIKEKQELQAIAFNAESDAKKWREQVEEQLSINDSMKSRVDDLHKTITRLEIQIEDSKSNAMQWELDSLKSRIVDLNKVKIELQTELQTMEVQSRQDETSRLKLSQECQELIKSNVTLKSELDDAQKRLKQEYEFKEEKGRRRQDQVKEVEILREESRKSKDELAMAKISIDNKDRKITEMGSKLRSTEAALNAAIEARTAFEERIKDLESRLHDQEQELIQLGQDKSLLIDDVAELRNNNELNSMKVSQLQRENHELKSELEKYQREMSTRKDFEGLISEIEMSGENYLHLMKNVKSYLAKKPQQGNGGGSNRHGGGDDMSEDWNGGREKEMEGHGDGRRDVDDRRGGGDNHRGGRSRERGSGGGGDRGGGGKSRERQNSGRFGGFGVECG